MYESIRPVTVASMGQGEIATQIGIDSHQTSGRLKFLEDINLKHFNFDRCIQYNLSVSSPLSPYNAL